MADTSQHTPRPKPRRGVYLLPNLFTTGALFAGFYSIVGSIHLRYEAAAIAIFIAMVLDSMDGRIARLTNTQSAFGTEYDSLADMVSFGVAPSLLMYQWSLASLGKPGWLAAFIYTACAALRLARFNTQVATADKAYFQGLPSPAAAAVIASLVWVGLDYEWNGPLLSLLTIVLTAVAGILMVSNVRYRSFKDLEPKGRVPFFGALVVVLLFVLISVDPPKVLFVIVGSYAVSGPLMLLVALVRRRQSSARRGGEGGPKGTE